MKLILTTWYISGVLVVVNSDNIFIYKDIYILNELYVTKEKYKQLLTQEQQYLARKVLYFSSRTSVVSSTRTHRVR